jgi:PII-like signaling protein
VHTKKRIELIIEKMAWKRAGRVLEGAGLTGYTVVPALAGYGGGNRWQRDADISAANDMVLMVSIGSSERVEKALVEIENLLGAHIGVVSVSDVQVLRDERF